MTFAAKGGFRPGDGGWVLAYRPGNDPFPRPEYELQELEARAAGHGLWRGTFTVPWKWRYR